MGLKGYPSSSPGFAARALYNTNVDDFNYTTELAFFLAPVKIVRLAVDCSPTHRRTMPCSAGLPVAQQCRKSGGSKGQFVKAFSL